MHKKNKEDRPKLFTKTALLCRGWTEKTIKSLLPPPTLLRNPHYHSASPMKMWAEQDVVDKEQSEEFKTAQMKKAIRSATAKNSCQKRKQGLLEQIEAIEITVKRFDKAALKRKTIWAKQEWEAENLNVGFVGSDVDDLTLQRWMVNFLRHNATDYDSRIHELFGLVGKREAYCLLKNRVLDRIAEEYPYLREECHRQKDKARLGVRI